ncbi:MAG: ABC transporter permease [Chromatiaceae bacterium]|jgi:ABC-2 type transport system permease protein|nr:ABC transporter permease [Chromatiaceae bacterium]MCW5585571.1 ABC transporter permease [Chromatiales bacterium]HPE81089.1 ABC transporter permease [Gammaproteobacteria bacterium]MCP5437592.1 ABC transporter permease [Chromatiaceae bacterium]MCP5439708.1 ABC transporter permease [Chromatiaceae bacterium]
MRHLSNIIRLGGKELRSLWSDKVLLVLVIWVFTGGIYVAATATATDIRNAPIGIVDEDHSPLSERIASAFYPPYFLPPVSIQLADADRLLDIGQFTFVLHIPARFERNVLAGKQPVAQLNVDATRMTQAFIGTNYVRNIFTGEIDTFVESRRAETSTPIELKLRYRFNPNLESHWFGSVMEIINNINLLAIILAGAAIIREREHGTLEHLLVMPLTPFEIMSAKVLANGLVIIAAAWFSIEVMIQGVLGVPVEGSVSLFLLGATLYLFSATAIGIFLGTLARSMPQLGLLMILVILPLQMLSGGITPRESMPSLVQDIMLAAPTTHFVSLAQGILYRGAGLDVVWPQFLAIIGIGVVFFLFALARFRRSITLTSL